MLNNDRGFTLIEIMAVLIIIGVIAGAVIWTFDVFNKGSTDKLAQIVVADLNEREKLEWMDAKLGPGWIDDATFFGDMKARGVYDLGKSKWQSGPTNQGGTLILNGNEVVLKRENSESTMPGKWSLP